MEVIKKSVFIIIFSALLISLQNFPYIYLSLNTPKDKVYLGAEAYYPDYYYFLFHINQGGHGVIAGRHLYTNEINDATLVHSEYNVFGKIGSLFNLSSQTIYILSRAIFLLIYILISFWFIGIFIKNSFHKILILILSFFYDGFFFLNPNNFYQPADFINRLTFEPHKFIGMSLTILIIYSIYKQKSFAVAFLSLLIGFIHGTSAVNLIAALFLFEFLLLISSVKDLPQFIKSNRFVITSLLLLPLSPLYWNFIFSKNPVINYGLVGWEKYFVQTDMQAPFLPILTAYLLILGPLIILSSLGLKKFLEENKKLGLLLLSFSVSNFILLFFGYSLLNTSRMRYYQTPYLLALCIIAYYGIIFLAKKINAKRGAFILIFTSLLVIPGIPNIVAGINKYIEAYRNSSDISVYLPTKWHQAILWLENTPDNSVILSLSQAGVIIPATPGRAVVIGYFSNSYGYYDKLPYAEKFFKGKMTASEAKAYLQKERVNYVFYGLEEKTYGSLSNYSSILKPVFENEDATIYKVAF